MSSRKIELRVGIVIFLAIIILGYAIMWLKEYKFNVERYQHQVWFPEVGSLDVGDPVGVLGVDKGEVKKIDIKEGRVLVTFNLTKDVVLKRDAEFTIMNIGLMGERFIQIKPGQSDTLLNLSTPSKGFYDTGIPEVMGMMGRGIDEIRELIRTIAGTIGTEQATTKVTEIIDNLLKVTRETRSLLDDTKKPLRKTVTDLSYSADQLRTFVDSNEAKFTNTVSNLDSASVKLLELTDKLSEISDNFKQISNKLNSKDNTLGTMLSDEQELYNSLKKTSEDLDSLILDIKKNPKKYIHLEIF
ncbi:MAG: MCE family protein [candidate division Zixibacteria bacterium]|nr:MCE family protein [candidate division Zixibacteria bacterium]